MRNTIWVLVTLITLSLLSACLYLDDESYRVEPVADDPPEVSVLTNLDTIPHPVVGDSLQVIYELSIVNGEFYFLEAVLSDMTVHSSDSAQGSFWIYPAQSNEPELDTLFIDFYHSSNTNTLADLTGYEARTFILKYAIDFSGEVEP